VRCNIIHLDPEQNICRAICRCTEEKKARMLKNKKRKKVESFVGKKKLKLCALKMVDAHKQFSIL
jgi:hypothetical protein